MIVKCIKTGFLKENCYILIKDNDALVIDPGDNYLSIKNLIKNKNVVGVLITHYHFDHIGALKELLNDYDAQVIDYKSSSKNINICNFNFKIIETKGHTSDSVSYYFKEDNVMFTGDFIFKESIGRCDMPTGDINDMMKSLKKLKEFNSNITLYPGHGDKTTLYNELKNNYYLR